MEQLLDISKADPDQKRAILKYATDVRKFEIERFWQRSLFFWGFIAAAFVAYATLFGKDDVSSLLVACFGLVCSIAWTLQNRGGKYWQEAWEQKVKIVERDVLGAELFSNRECLKRTGWWGAARFSVSRMAIALSDFTVIVWIVLVGRVAASLLPISVPRANSWWALIAMVVTVPYVFLLLLRGRSRLVGEATP